jgi:hypothetical protein
VLPLPDITLSFVPWPIGQTVSVFPRVSELHMDDMPPPMQPLVGTGDVQQDKSLTFPGVEPGSYWAIAPIGGRYQYVSFEIP